MTNLDYPAMSASFKLLLCVLFPSVLFFPAGKMYLSIFSYVCLVLPLCLYYTEYLCHESSLLSRKSDDHAVQKRAECEYNRLLGIE